MKFEQTKLVVSYVNLLISKHEKRNGAEKKKTRTNESNMLT